MNIQTLSLIENTKKKDRLTQPIFFHLTDNSEKNKFEQLLQDTPNIQVFDEIEGQLQELIKLRHPKIKLTKDQSKELIQQHLGSISMNEYGVWVYYPWLLKIIHILDKEEFTEVRTNRNRYKITEEEATVLSTKKMGIMGLSVGRSIAMTMATERIASEIRLADFDILELSNYNRIQASLTDLGVSKVTSAARQIAEIDPFLKVVCYHEGITEQNIDDFFLEGGKLDIVLDECDGLDIKVFGRKKAKELGIPVVMDTSDRGMIDVERFDLEPDRPILHGLIDHLDTSNLKGLTNEEKIPYILPMVGMETISTRLKASMLEVEQTITTWPQLASSVMLGGALAVDVCRRIALNQFQDSGRYNIDLEQLIRSEKSDHDSVLLSEGTKRETDQLFLSKMKEMTNQLGVLEKEGLIDLDSEVLNQIVDAAITAPSGGNAQPWKWLYQNKKLHLFLDENRSKSFLDFDFTSSYTALGAAVENVFLKSHEIGLEVEVEYFPIKNNRILVASFSFLDQSIVEKSNNHKYDELVSSIYERATNRNPSNGKLLPEEKLMSFQKIIEELEGAKLYFTNDEKDLLLLKDVFGVADRIRLLHPTSHYDMYYNELRFTPEESLKRRDGVDLATIPLTNSEIAGVKLTKDVKVVKYLREWNKGSGFERISRNAIESTSNVGLITMPNHDYYDFLISGRVIQRMWLAATQENIAIYPMLVPIMFFNRIKHEGKTGIPSLMMEELNTIRKKFLEVFPIDNNVGEVFLFQCYYAPAPKVRSLRLPVDEVLFKE